MIQVQTGLMSDISQRYSSLNSLKQRLHRLFMASKNSLMTKMTSIVGLQYTNWATFELVGQEAQPQ